MKMPSVIRVAVLAFAALAGVALSSAARADEGFVQLTIYKAGWIIGGSGGSGSSGGTGGGGSVPGGISEPTTRVVGLLSAAALGEKRPTTRVVGSDGRRPTTRVVGSDSALACA